MGRVQNKIALITGGSRGIGAETARLLASEGAKVIITDILVEDGEAIANSIGGQFYSLDVGDEVQWQQITSIIGEKFDHIDILFNNAGVIGLNGDLGPQDPENISLESWHHVHRINLDGIFLGC